MSNYERQHVTAQAQTTTAIDEQRIAPRANRFPLYPPTWYLFGTEHEVQHGPVSKSPLGRQLVAFCTETGQVAVLDARCCHQGADLGRGDVVGETIQCPFHHWCFAPDGRCVHIPNLANIPEFACQRSYPTVTRHGYVFLFNGPTALFPLPFFIGDSPAEFVAGHQFTFRQDCPWYQAVANAFDTEHFRSVHGRAMIGTEKVDCPSPFARRIRFNAEVTGDSVQDRLLRAFIGHRVDISITSWGGAFLAVTATFARARSHIFIMVHPISAGQTVVEVIAMSRRLRPAFFQQLNLWVRRWFTQGFLSHDVERLAGIRYNPRTFTVNERVIVEFYQWLAQLPRGSTYEGIG